MFSDVIIRLRRCQTISEVLINEEIREREVRLIDEDGTQVGIVPTQNAMNMAIEKNLDLVMIAPGSKPPVCKLMDYSKYQFDQKKKEKEARKKQKTMEVKEVRLSPNIGDHDFEVKRKNAQKFLEEGNKVKVSVRFRGREMTHTELGRDVLVKFAEGISDVSTQTRIIERRILKCRNLRPKELLQSALKPLVPES